MLQGRGPQGSVVCARLPLGQEASAELVSSLPGAPVRRPPHSHAVLHLCGYRHAGKPQPPFPWAPVPGSPKPVARCTLVLRNGKSSSWFFGQPLRLLKGCGDETDVAPWAGARAWGGARLRGARRGWNVPRKAGLSGALHPTLGAGPWNEKTHS